MSRGKETPGWEEYTRVRYLPDGEESCKELGRGGKKYNVAIKWLDPAPSDCILDLGCGTGELVKLLHKDIKILGMDYSLEGVKLAKGVVNEGIIIQADARCLPFHAEVFDKVVMLDIVEHLSKPDLLKCLTELKRVLKSDGSALILTPNLWGEKLDMIDRRILRRESPAHFVSHLHVNVMSPIALKSIIKRAGFKSKLWFNCDATIENNPRYRVIATKLLWFATAIWCKAYK